MNLFEFMSVCPNGVKIMLKDYNGGILVESANKDQLEHFSSYELFYQHEKVESFVADCQCIYIKLKFLADYGTSIE